MPTEPIRCQVDHELTEKAKALMEQALLLLQEVSVTLSMHNSYHSSKQEMRGELVILDGIK